MSVLGTRNRPDSNPCVGRCSHCAGSIVCIGCGRLIEEVRDWNTYTSAEKIKVKQLAQERIKK